MTNVLKACTCIIMIVYRYHKILIVNHNTLIQLNSSFAVLLLVKFSITVYNINIKYCKAISVPNHLYDCTHKLTHAQTTHIQFYGIQPNHVHSEKM